MTYDPNCTCDPADTGGGQWRDPNCPVHGTARALTLEYGDPPMDRPLRIAIGLDGEMHLEATGDDGVTRTLPMTASAAEIKTALIGEPPSAELPNPFAKVNPRTTAEHARSICEAAADLVNGPRNVDYGDALDNFTETAALWTPILGVEISAEQVALCLGQVKVARLIHNLGHRDSWLDAVGYTALGGGIARRRETEQ